MCVVTTAVVRPTSRRRRRCSRRRPSSRRISGDGPVRESNPGCTRVCVVVVVCGGAVVVGVVGSSSSGGVVCTSSARTSGGSSRGRPRSRPRSRHGDIVRDRAGARASAARGRRATCRHEVNVCSSRHGQFRSTRARLRRRHHRPHTTHSAPRSPFGCCCNLLALSPPLFWVHLSVPVGWASRSNE